MKYVCLCLAISTFLSQGNALASGQVIIKNSQCQEMFSDQSSASLILESVVNYLEPGLIEEVQSQKLTNFEESFETKLKAFQNNPDAIKAELLFSFPKLFIEAEFNLPKITRALETLNAALEDTSLHTSLFDTSKTRLTNSIYNSLFGSPNYIFNYIEYLPRQLLEDIALKLLNYELKYYQVNADTLQIDKLQKSILYSHPELNKYFGIDVNNISLVPAVNSHYSLKLQNKLAVTSTKFSKLFIKNWSTSEIIPTVIFNEIKIIDQETPGVIVNCGACDYLHVGHVNSITQRENHKDNIHHSDAALQYRQNTYVVLNHQLIGSIKWGKAGNNSFIALSNVTNSSKSTVFIAGGTYRIPKVLMQLIKENKYPNSIDLNVFNEILYFQPLRFLQHPTRPKPFIEKDFQELITHLREEALTHL